MKPKLKPPGTKRLKPKCDMLLSTSAFKFNLLRYDAAGAAGATDAVRRRLDGQLRDAAGLADARVLDLGRACQTLLSLATSSDRMPLTQELMVRNACR